jgi:hypothetical protein
MDPDLPAQIAKYAGGSALLGPSAILVGSRLANATEWTLDNVERMFRRATDRSKGSTDPVNPRVLARTVDEASVSDDEVMAEYLGGVLASSRTADGKDDRGVAFVASVGRLSSSTLALHYACYAHAAVALAGADVNPQMETELQSHRVFIGLEALFATARISDGTALSHGLFAMNSTGLLTGFVSGSPEHLRANGVPYAAEHGLLYQLTFAGIELFMWGMGLGQRPTREYFRLTAAELSVQGIDLVGRSVRLGDMPPLESAPTAPEAHGLPDASPPPIP